MIRAVLAVLVLSGAGACEDRVPSPTGVLFAQYADCSGQNPCTPEVVITNQGGAEVRRFAIRTDQGPCGSIVPVQSARISLVRSATVTRVVPGNSDLVDTLAVEPRPFLHPSFCINDPSGSSA
jgi:hypothetical protein